MSTFVQDVKYMGYTCTHPFNGFYELRFRRQRNWIIILAIFLMIGLVDILALYHTGIIVSGSVVIGADPLFMMVTAVFPFLVFAVSNWAITSIFDGNGSFSDVLMVMAYAVVPKLVIDLIVIVLSNVIIQPEMFMIQAISTIGMIIFGFLVFCGLCVIHEYSAAKCVVTLFATALAAVLIMFIGIVYVVLMGRMFGMAQSIFAEITRRGVVF